MVLACGLSSSGAIFGLMGMTLVVARSRGLSEAVNQIGVLVVINLVITFGYSGISKGAHLGGLIGGMLYGWLGRNKADIVGNG